MSYQSLLLIASILLAGCMTEPTMDDVDGEATDPAPLPAGFDLTICELQCSGGGTDVLWGFSGAIFERHEFRLDRPAKMHIDMHGSDSTTLRVDVLIDGRILDERIGPGTDYVQPHTWFLFPGEYELVFLLEGHHDSSIGDPPRFVGWFEPL